MIYTDASIVSEATLDFILHANDWISSHVAARILGMHESGFRRRYCRQDAPKVATLENGQVGNKRRFKVLRADIERLKSERRAARY